MAYLLHDHRSMTFLQQKLAEANSLGMRRLILASVSELEHPVDANCHLGTLNNALPEGSRGIVVIHPSESNRVANRR